MHISGIRINNKVLILPVLFCILAFWSGCNRNKSPHKTIEDGDNNSDTALQFVNDPDKLSGSIVKKEKIKIYGDTVWIKPYGIGSWSDTLSSGIFQAYIYITVDTNDYIIDTVVAPKGNRLVIGFNQHYNIMMKKNNRHLFDIQFDKKSELASLLRDSESWIDCKLDAFQTLIYNKKYDKFIIEFNINPGYDLGSVFYFVIGSNGNIEFKGQAGTWSSEEPYNSSFITSDNQLYISSLEVYSFKKHLSMPVDKFAELASFLTFGEIHKNYSRLFAARKLQGSKFLAVFDYIQEGSVKNALILSTDTSIVGSFEYSGIVDDLENFLLFDSIQGANKTFLYDIERKTLISLLSNDSFIIKEHKLNDMMKIDGDTMPQDSYMQLNFEAFGSYRFYFSNTDSAIYYDIDRLE